LHISQRGFGLLGLGLGSSLFMGSSAGNPAYTDIASCGADNSLLASRLGSPQSCPLADEIRLAWKHDTGPTRVHCWIPLKDFWWA
jgi:hypothetical protein